jgi:hypothetical protein
MDKQNSNLPPTSDIIKNIYKDRKGNILQTFEMGIKTTEQEGLFTTEKTGFSQILADDVAYHPGQSIGKQPVRIGSCYFCWRKDPSQSSLITLENAIRCVDCRHLACPDHIRRSYGQ